MESLSDIVAEMRTRSRELKQAWGEKPDGVENMLDIWADRIEAAAKRECEASEDETLVKSCNTCKNFTRKRKWCRVHDYSPSDPSKLPLIWPNGPCPQWECKYNGRGGAK